MNNYRIENISERNISINKENIIHIMDPNLFISINNEINEIIELSRDVRYILFFEIKKLFQLLPETERFLLYWEKKDNYNKKHSLICMKSMDIKIDDMDNYLRQQLFSDSKNYYETFSSDILEHIVRIESIIHIFDFDNEKLFNDFMFLIHKKSSDNLMDPEFLKSLGLNSELIEKVEKNQFSSIDLGIENNIEHFDFLCDLRSNADVFEYHKFLINLNFLCIIVNPIKDNNIEILRDFNRILIKNSADPKDDTLLKIIVKKINMNLRERISLSFLAEKSAERITNNLQKVNVKYLLEYYSDAEIKSRLKNIPVKDSPVDIFLSEIEKNQIKSNLVTDNLPVNISNKIRL